MFWSAFNFFAMRPRSVAQVMRSFILASVPAVVIGCWLAGSRLLAVAAEAGGGLAADVNGSAVPWQLRLFAGLGFDTSMSSWVAQLLLGLSCWLPMIVVAAGTGRLWAALFAHVRRRPLDPGWLMNAWLFVLLLPPTMPLYLVALGLSFGAVFGGHVFGGTGRYFASPALLAAVFLQLAYPGHFVPDFGAGTGSWMNLAPGYLAYGGGAAAAVACLIGAAYLIVTGAASWRTMLAACGGLLLAAVLFPDPSWVRQPVLGSFALVAVFVATDPTVMPLTRIGRWITGALFGMLTAWIRLLHPDHPEGTLPALLLALLFAPLFDHLLVELQIRLRIRRRRGRDARA